MKIHPLLILSGALLSLASAPPARAVDNIEINPATGPAQLTLTGPAALAEGIPGLIITHADDDGSTFGLSVPVSVGKFQLRRPVGFYQWNFTEADGTTPRPALELNDDHSLLIRSNVAADRAAEPEAYAIELRPGIEGGVFFNGVRLLSTFGEVLSTSLTVGGGQLGMGDFTPYWWQGLFAAPGLMAVGDDARAFGHQAVALGFQARSGYFSVALGGMATAQFRSTALGWNSTAINQATAIAGGYAIGHGAVALGPSSYANSEWSTAVGSSAAATAWYAVGIGGWAIGPNSWAGAWGWSDTAESIALGGNAYGFKSFAAHSGVTYAPHSVAIGRGTIAAQDYQAALGSLNVDPRRPISGFNVPQAGDPLFMIGNGYPVHDGQPVNQSDPLSGYYELRSNAFTVGYEGNAWVRGGLTVEGKAIVRGAEAAIVEVPAPSVFKGDVSVQGNLSLGGVLRVQAAGDLGMGDFGFGTQP